MARVTLSQAGEDVIVGGADVQVVGTSAGGEVITVISGNIRLDPSFNQGGDTIRLPGAASSYTAYRSGGEVIFASLDGSVTLRIPVGSVGTEIEFSNGDSRTLLFDAATGTATLEGQALGTSSTAPTALSAGSGGPAPTTGYDVVNSSTAVVEGDSGNRSLVFTIELDRAVTAQDGPVTLNFRTLDGTALSASDYVAAAGQVTFGVGQRFATVTVQITGDIRQESDETLQLELTGAALRNGTELLNGVILNDDVVTALTAGADAINGTVNNDIFLAANRNLGAGDRIDGLGGSDTVSVAIDGSVFANGGNGNFGGFELNNIEALEITNDSGGLVSFDLSGSGSLQRVASVNSADSIAFNQLANSNIVVGLTRLTGTNADVTANFVAAATVGATNVVVDINNSTSDELFLLTNGAQAGIETVTFQVTGASEIDALRTNLTNLVVTGGSLTIDQALATTIRSIDASQASGLDVDFSLNAAAVTVQGASGANLIAAGNGNDTITTQGGNDAISDTGGDNSIVTGTGNDTVSFAAATFNRNDSVNLGGNDGDVLVINEVAVEAELANVRGATTLDIRANGVSVIGVNDTVPGSGGETAGIRIVNLNTGAAGNDSLDARGYTSSLTVNLGAGIGQDTVLLGSGDDIVNTSEFSNDDSLVGGAGRDTINVSGASNVAAGQFSGFEQINFAPGSVAGQDSGLSLTDLNAPTSNGTLTIDASALRATTTTNAALNETLDLNASGVTLFSVNVTGGAAADTINTANSRSDTVNGGAGADTITVGTTVVGGGDVARGDGGNDIISIGAGNNNVDGGEGNDTINLNAGVGNNTIQGGAGNDRIEIAGDASLNGNDIIDGGVGGTDTLSVLGIIADAQLGSVSNVEVLEARNGATSTITLGVEALEAGINRVNLLNAGADTLTVGAGFTADLTVDATAGGDDVITTNIGNDLIITGVGNNTINTGAGNDRIRVSGNTELQAADVIAAGAGTDTIELDVTTGTDATVSTAVIATVNVANVTGVERYTVIGGGDRIAGTNTGDVDNSVLTFTGAAASSSAPIVVDASGLTDAADSLRVVLANTGDIAFTVFGSATATTVVEKQGINNTLNFFGGAGRDELRINGNDAVTGVVFNGGGGTNDRIVLTGGTLSDVSFIDVSEVEILTADGVGVNATLGARAAAAGIVQVLGALGQSDDVTVTSGFFNEAGLLVVLNGGVDRINAGGSNARITFREAAGELTATDILTGGRGQLDSLDITAGGSANVDGVTRVETININNSTLATGNPLETTNLDLGTLLANEIDADRLTINFNNAGTGDVLNLAGAAVAANITVTGGAEADTLNTGSGADIINGLGGADVINAGGGADTVNGGAGNDNVSGGAGADTLNGDAGNDMLMGNDGSDVINGGDGNDTINGGLGADRLSGNAGADVFVYASLEDSRSTPTAGEPTDNRDTIVSFTAGEDKIDLTALAGAQAIRYNGSFQTFAEAQAAVGGSQNDGNLDAVLVRDLGGRSILFVDVDNNGQLDGNDLQVVLEGLNGSLTRADFLPAAPVAVVGLDEQFSMHYDAGFTSHHFA